MATDDLDNDAGAAFDGLNHIPIVVSDRPACGLHMRPVGIKLQCSNIKPWHIDEAVACLHWTHTVRKRFHRDISYSNLLLCPADWRRGESDLSESLAVLLVDWEMSVPMGDVRANNAQDGTVLTMSQGQLSANIIAGSGKRPYDSYRPSFKYTVQDELEAMVKSVLLILSPALKIRVKHQASSAWRGAEVERYRQLHRLWKSVLPANVLALCKEHRYEELARWLKRALLHFDPEEEPPRGMRRVNWQAILAIGGTGL